jgi:hypothetical protein
MSRQRPEHCSVSVKDIHYEPAGYCNIPNTNKGYGFVLAMGRGVTV